MRKILIITTLALLTTAAAAQTAPMKERSDAFPWVPEPEPKVINMATSVEQMADWDRYPTYSTYLTMMEQWATEFPSLCHVDTIGRSVQGRLVLAMRIDACQYCDVALPEFFYSSTIHGDEVTGYVLMLRLIDTLLRGYGSNEYYTEILNRTRISINPLANPDGTYHGGNNTLSGAMRYNANYVDLNRNFPDPFGTSPINDEQQEVTDMIEYVRNHRFALSANLHGGAEVLNYPWDSFTTSEREHPYRDWWIDVCKRFIDTMHVYSRSHFTDITNSGYIAGGDWYVISNGRQDYLNQELNCLEMTMEVSSIKKLSSDELPSYWRFLQNSLVNYITEVWNLPTNNSDCPAVASTPALRYYPNPTRDRIRLSEPAPDELRLYNAQGALLQQLPKGTQTVELNSLPQGIYMLRCGDSTAKIVKQ